MRWQGRHQLTTAVCGVGMTELVELGPSGQVPGAQQVLGKWLFTQEPCALKATDGKSVSSGGGLGGRQGVDPGTISQGEVVIPFSF